MPNGQKRVMITLQPERESTLTYLKKEKFNDVTQAQMLRHIIDMGLATVRDAQLARCDNGPKDV